MSNNSWVGGYSYTKEAQIVADRIAKIIQNSNDKEIINEQIFKDKTAIAIPTANKDDNIIMNTFIKNFKDECYTIYFIIYNFILLYIIFDSIVIIVEHKKFNDHNNVILYLYIAKLIFAAILIISYYINRIVFIKIFHASTNNKMIIKTPYFPPFYYIYSQRLLWGYNLLYIISVICILCLSIAIIFLLTHDDNSGDNFHKYNKYEKHIFISNIVISIIFSIIFIYPLLLIKNYFWKNLK
jgi:hypothetical protein